MNKEQIENYNSHALFMKDIAISNLKGNGTVLNINGVKEIIALYLLIPYISSETLKTPHPNCIIPKISGQFIGEISLEDLRNTICHSFVTIEEDKHDGTMHGKKLIFDDRIFKKKKEHSQQDFHSSCYCINTNEVHNKLIEIFNSL